MSINWKIYYENDLMFSSLDGSPWLAPGLGVQVIVMIDREHGWRTQAGDDYYVWDCRGDETRWWGVDQFGLWEYLFTQPGHKCALAGRTTTGDQFNEIFERASNDPDFPQKTAFDSKERKP